MQYITQRMIRLFYISILTMLHPPSNDVTDCHIQFIIIPMYSQDNYIFIDCMICIVSQAFFAVIPQNTKRYTLMPGLTGTRKPTVILLKSMLLLLQGQSTPNLVCIFDFSSAKIALPA